MGRAYNGHAALIYFYFFPFSPLAVKGLINIHLHLLINLYLGIFLQYWPQSLGVEFNMGCTIFLVIMWMLWHMVLQWLCCLVILSPSGYSTKKKEGYPQDGYYWWQKTTSMYFHIFLCHLPFVFYLLICIWANLNFSILVFINRPL